MFILTPLFPNGYLKAVYVTDNFHLNASLFSRGQFILEKSNLIC